jgi:hypothetical protein
MDRSRLSVLVATALVLALEVVPAGAGLAQQDARIVVLPSLAGRQIDMIKRKTDVPVLLPTLFPTYARYVYPAAGFSRKAWALRLGAIPQCEANACFIAAFTGKRAKSTRLTGKRVKLRGGLVGTYRSISCGGSCAPASIAFLRGGVRYEFQVKGSPASRGAMVKLANLALAAGPR